MARLQVLHLPSVLHEDEAVQPRFALILDQANDLNTEGDFHRFAGDLRQFSGEIGAAGVYITSTTVDVQQGDDGEVTDELAAEIAVLVREHVQARVAEAGSAVAEVTRDRLHAAGLLADPKPPADTSEGKAARVWGATKEDSRG